MSTLGESGLKKTLHVTHTPRFLDLAAPLKRFHELIRPTSSSFPDILDFPNSLPSPTSYLCRLTGANNSQARNKTRPSALPTTCPFPTKLDNRQARSLNHTTRELQVASDCRKQKAGDRTKWRRIQSSCLRATVILNWRNWWPIG